VIFDLLDSTSNTVVYEAAISLASLTSNPAAIKGLFLNCVKLTVAAAVKLIDLAIKESDNNVKLIVLNKVSDLHQEHEGVLEEQVMELLRVLSRSATACFSKADSSPDIDVRTKVLKIALTMITSKNVEHFISVLEKELKNTVEQDYEKVRPGPWVSLILEHGISTTSYPFHTYLCCSIFRSGGQWYSSSDGVYKRIQ
jgi:coatomer subunit beta